ncbi:bifunctional 2-C-methyl-D-erythritol 4-phosphate cytidylyltransferase/2-C-methyl-D-erythritol 2,4-cyclodiphosphate synthase [Erythrobacter litoralis]|uniref:bifunctional 2-C-methyl-D-erythritol 4-phosphate cytidylyltransferase/2-C-methyl-D-erythritol 2,4-cyclodiphosphate synthase n=1 Tax=Erythrobacter litoralis TaxID=39960 RepID=UPI002434DF11|nr:bifunctional 2-C-methyl-D-erythritol 4-phosphate cytidylyltransferase/2-C-methyl-D-erythritol 2,4-cyclodiphosphate synthase [Erythrobacter litoralis]MDG6078196.1 bifunctional 2-C-methyl-D-erythritol 4-phosphate cytidylyltransferase/2-C-methyl-D-erythritol 2,4-cyclodiphosphate synthase [Erythrobacter litoralis]
MTAPPPPSRFAAVVVAAGKGERAAQGVPKQFASYRGKSVLRHSVEGLVKAGAGKIVIAVPEGYEALAADMIGPSDIVEFVAGGITRQESVAAALTRISPQFEAVLIHDAARPFVPGEVVDRLLAALQDYAGVIPVLPVVDSLATGAGTIMMGSADRNALRRVQTPQAFNLRAIKDAHEAWGGISDAGDDAQVLRANGGVVAMVEGDERLRKLTFAEDFREAPSVRVGTGFDVHRLASGEELWLGGVRIEHDRGLAGHSDADVALHALTDAVLGAIGAGDIGSHFPPSDPEWRGASSDRFLVHAVELADARGYRIGNIDLTIMCEAPKIGPHRERMRERIAELVEVDIDLVSVKATTTERLGFTGREEGIAAQAVATLLSN